MNLEKNIIIPKILDFKEFEDNTAYFHALFDNYLNPNLGNNPKNSLEFFKNVIDTLISSKYNNKDKQQINNIFDLLQNSHNVAETMLSEFKINKKFCFYDFTENEYSVEDIIENYQKYLKMELLVLKLMK